MSLTNGDVQHCTGSGRRIMAPTRSPGSSRCRRCGEPARPTRGQERVALAPSGPSHSGRATTADRSQGRAAHEAASPFRSRRSWRGSVTTTRWVSGSGVAIKGLEELLLASVQAIDARAPRRPSCLLRRRHHSDSPRGPPSSNICAISRCSSSKVSSRRAAPSSSHKERLPRLVVPREAAATHCSTFRFRVVWRPQELVLRVLPRPHAYGPTVWRVQDGQSEEDNVGLSWWCLPVSIVLAGMTWVDAQRRNVGARRLGPPPADSPGCRSCPT